MAENQHEEHQPHEWSPEQLAAAQAIATALESGDIDADLSKHLAESVADDMEIHFATTMHVPQAASLYFHASEVSKALFDAFIFGLQGEVSVENGESMMTAEIEGPGEIVNLLRVAWLHGFRQGYELPATWGSLTLKEE